MESVDVALASAIRPPYVNRGAVIGINSDRKRGADAFLTERGRIGPRDRGTLNDDAAWKFIGRVSECLECIGAGGSGIVTDDDDVAGGGSAIKFAPTEKGGVDGIVGSD